MKNLSKYQLRVIAVDEEYRRNQAWKQLETICTQMERTYFKKSPEDRVEYLIAVRREYRSFLKQNKLKKFKGEFVLMSGTGQMENGQGYLGLTNMIVAARKRIH